MEAEPGEGLGAESEPLTGTAHQDGESSPAQQSPDQSNYMDNYRSPEVAEENQLNSPGSPMETAHEDSNQDLPSGGMDDIDHDLAGSGMDEEMEAEAAEETNTEMVAEDDETMAENDVEAKEHMSDDEKVESVKEAEDEPDISGEQVESNNETEKELSLEPEISSGEQESEDVEPERIAGEEEELNTEAEISAGEQEVLNNEPEVSAGSQEDPSDEPEVSASEQEEPFTERDIETGVQEDSDNEPDASNEEPEVSPAVHEEEDVQIKHSDDNDYTETEETSSEFINSDEKTMNIEQIVTPDNVNSPSDKQGCDNENIQEELDNNPTHEDGEICDSKMDYDSEYVKEGENVATNGSRDTEPDTEPVASKSPYNNDDNDLDRAHISDVLENQNTISVKGHDELNLNEEKQASDLQPVESVEMETTKTDAVEEDSDSKQESDSEVANDKPGEDETASLSEDDIVVCAAPQEPEPVIAGTTSITLPEKEEKDEGEISEASLEEVSEEEDDDGGDQGAESGIEEVSDEEDDIKGQLQGNVSGVEEVSEEEEEHMQDSSPETPEEGRRRKGGKRDPSINQVSDDDMVETPSDPRNGKDHKDQRDAESGMEEVSDEEEEDGQQQDSDEAEDGEDVSEGMEDISSEEEEGEEEEEEEEREEEVEKRKENGEPKVLDGRTVEIKQNGEVVKIDDSGKEDSEIVQEILENMTIKIDNVNKLEQTNSEELECKERSSRSDRDRSRKKKERRESIKSKTSASAAKSDHKKDLRDINERLKAQASYGEDIELDYDDVHEEKEKAGSDSDALTSSESDEGELSEEEDCEEGEIREPGAKPFVKPTCRFFMRGHCTWGVNCRFLHPGINDKGYYQLIERPGFNNKPPPPVEDQWEEEERSPSPEPPPAPKEPKEETAWERGLRQAKELRKKAMERRELETNFEHKKLNLSIEENPEYNKENKVEEEKPVVKKKQVYYEKEVFSDDEYYDQTPVRLQQKQQQEQSWAPGQYENFEVRWSREPPGYYPPGPPQPHSNYPGAPHHPAGPGSRYSQYAEQSFRGREGNFPPRRPSPKHFSPSPPPHYQKNQRYGRPQRDPRMEAPMRREKVRERQMSSPPPKGIPLNPNKIKADEWHDPWRRSNANKAKSPPTTRKRSRSRGRRRSRRSHSYSSSYSSSSYSDSSRSRSRSSSFSSVSSRSRSRSRSRSSSASSKSPPPRRNPAPDRRRPPPPQPGYQGARRMPPHDQPRSAVAFRGGRGGRGRSPDKRPGMGPMGPGKGMHRGPPPMQGRGHPGQGRAQMMDRGDRGGMHAPGRAPGGKMMDMGRRPDNRPDNRGMQQQRRFQMEVKGRERIQQTSALNKDKRRGRRRSATSSRSRSRSSSSSSRSSRSSSYSSRSSRSSSSSSSGSADSDHLYRNIGGKDSQRQGPPPRNRQQDKGRYKQSQDGRQKMPSKPDAKTMVIREGEFGQPLSALPQKPKDPLKVMGQKSNIKLTLIKPSDKAPEQMAKKRPADHDMGAPPAKRPSMASQPKSVPEKPLKKADKVGPVSPTKMLQSPMKAAVAAPSGPSAPAAPAPVAKKKSTVNRREELLKQLKAVEDAIAKKKKKMT